MVWGFLYSGALQLRGRRHIATLSTKRKGDRRPDRISDKRSDLSERSEILGCPDERQPVRWPRREAFFFALFFLFFRALPTTPRLRACADHLGGPKHWGKLRPLLPDGVPVGQLMQQHWHCWRICHGWLRFSELTGELQVSKGAGREGRGRTSSFVFFLLFFTKR